jgi:hypothetical protein
VCAWGVGGCVCGACVDEVVGDGEGTSGQGRTRWIVWSRLSTGTLSDQVMSSRDRGAMQPRSHWPQAVAWSWDEDEDEGRGGEG